VPESPHFKVTPISFPKQRWANKCGEKETIEAKPWYMRSFEEVVELECGEELRDERVGKYNKSFVTKTAKFPKPPLFAFNTVVKPQPEKRAEKVRNPSNTSSRVESLETAVPSRRLKAKVLMEQIALVESKIEEETKKMNTDVKELMKLRGSLSKSQEALFNLQERSTRAVAITQSAVQSLISNHRSSTERQAHEWGDNYLQNLRKRDDDQLDQLEKKLAHIHFEGH
jgi:ElaB/YqjD/DUF883 family membrane-anchored ribosome-binding protein